jgi:hypothetical protein|tara:strand:- start:109 stop:561 length:453 start_codon:yes stop_codon:yes gene_type:complete
MASTYRTKRKKIVDAYVKQLEGINGQSPYNSNIFNEVHGNTLFIDQITQFPSVCVIAGDETREYQPGGFKWRYLNLEIRTYVSDENDPQEELALLIEDIERVIDNNDILTYDDSVSPNLNTTSSTILTIATDEGVLAPLGVGEIAIQVRY